MFSLYSFYLGLTLNTYKAFGKVSDDLKQKMLHLDSLPEKRIILIIYFRIYKKKFKLCTTLIFTKVLDRTSPTIWSASSVICIEVMHFVHAPQ